MGLKVSLFRLLPQTTLGFRFRADGFGHLGTGFPPRQLLTSPRKGAASFGPSSLGQMLHIRRFGADGGLSKRALRMDLDMNVYRFWPCTIGGVSGYRCFALGNDPLLGDCSVDVVAGH